MTWMFYTSMEGVNTMNNSLAVKMSQHTLRKKCLYLELFWSAFFPHFPVFGKIQEKDILYLHSETVATYDSNYLITIVKLLQLIL